MTRLEMSRRQAAHARQYLSWCDDGRWIQTDFVPNIVLLHWFNVSAIGAWITFLMATGRANRWASVNFKRPGTDTPSVWLSAVDD
jgi:hypothetical protein